MKVQRATSLSVNGRVLKRAEAGRVCNFDGCGTRLTTYNTKATCYLHTPKRVPRIRGRNPDKIDALGVDTTLRCYVCAIRLGGWGNEAHEFKDSSGDYHWWIKMSAGTSLSKLCDVR